MRESIGATFLIKIMIIFIVLYNSLLAIAVNYAMVFRVKNRVINLVEQYEGCSGAREHIKEYISKVGYYRAASSNKKQYEITTHSTSTGTYYTVTTYISFEFPIVKNIINFPIRGETKVIYGIDENQSQCDNIY